MRRPVPLLLLAAVVLTAVGCAPATPEASPAPSSTSSASASPSPSAESPVPTPTPTDEADAEELAQACVVSVQESGSGAAAVVRVAEARTADLGEGRWAVAVPMTLDGAEGSFVCTGTGGRDQFALEVRAATDIPVTESWREDLAMYIGG